MNVSYIISASLSQTSPLYSISLEPSYSFKNTKSNYYSYFPFLFRHTVTKTAMRKTFVAWTNWINGLTPVWEAFFSWQYEPRSFLVSYFNHSLKGSSGNSGKLLYFCLCFLSRIRWIIGQEICIFAWNRIFHWVSDACFSGNDFWEFTGVYFWSRSFYGSSTMSLGSQAQPFSFL